MKPRLKTSSSSPRTDTTSAALRLDLEAAGGFAERAGAVVQGHRRSLLLPAARSRARATRTAARPSESNSAQAAWRLRPSTSERPRHDRVRLADPHRARRAAPSAARAPSAGRSPKFATGALVGQSSAAQTHSGRTRPVPSPSDSSGVQSAANSPSRSSPGNTRSPSPRLALGPQTTQVGKGWSALQCSRPAADAAAASAGLTGSGTSSSSSSGSPSATSVSPSRSSTRSPSRTTASGRSSGGGSAQRDRRPPRRPTSPATRPARVAAVRRPRRAVEAGGDGQRLGHARRRISGAPVEGVKQRTQAPRRRRGRRSRPGARGRRSRPAAGRGRRRPRTRATPPPRAARGPCASSAWLSVAAAR